MKYHKNDVDIHKFCLFLTTPTLFQNITNINKYVILFKQIHYGKIQNLVV